MLSKNTAKQALKDGNIKKLKRYIKQGGDPSIFQDPNLLDDELSKEQINYDLIDFLLENGCQHDEWKITVGNNAMTYYDAPLILLPLLRKNREDIDTVANLLSKYPINCSIGRCQNHKPELVSSFYLSAAKLNFKSSNFSLLKANLLHLYCLFADYEAALKIYTARPELLDQGCQMSLEDLCHDYRPESVSSLAEAGVISVPIVQRVREADAPLILLNITPLSIALENPSKSKDFIKFILNKEPHRVKEKEAYHSEKKITRIIEGSKLNPSIIRGLNKFQQRDLADSYTENAIRLLQQFQGKKLTLRTFKKRLFQLLRNSQKKAAQMDVVAPLLLTAGEQDPNESVSTITTTTTTSTTTSLLTNLAPPKKINRHLIVGGGPMFYAFALVQKHRQLAPYVTATEYDSESVLGKKTKGYSERCFRFFKRNIKALRTRGTSLQFGVDARQLEQHFQGERFERIHFNFPHDGSRYQARTLPQLLAGFFRSARGLQVYGDRVLMALPKLDDCDKKRFYHSYVYNIYTAAANAGYGYDNKRKFDEERYTEYVHHQTKSASSAEVAKKAREYIFVKTDLTAEEIKRHPKYKPGGMKKCLGEVNPYLQEIETDSDSSDYGCA